MQKPELRDGHYLLRSNLVGENPSVLWECYIQLTQIEAAFRTLKSELGLRPIYHQVECGSPHLRGLPGLCAFSDPQAAVGRLRAGPDAPCGAGKTGHDSDARCVFAHDDGRRAIMPRYTQPEPDQSLLLHQLNLTLPSQPPPRIKTPQEAAQTLPRLKM